MHIVRRDVRGCTNSTCVQIRIPSTCIIFFGGLSVCISPQASSVDLIGTFKDARIMHEFNSVFHVGDCITFII